MPYLDAPTITKWGIKASVLADRRFEDAESLKAYGQSVLNEMQNPYVTYSAQAVDLYRLTGREYDKFNVGDIVRIVDKEDGIFGDFPIVSVEKSDITGNPGGVNVTIANKTKDLAGSITDLQSRALVNELYSQGATNQLMVNFADNADIENPALMKLYVPESMVRVNSCVLQIEFEPFRAYERGVASVNQSVQTTSSTKKAVSTSSSTSAQTPTTSTAASQTPTTSYESTTYPTTTTTQTSSETTDSSPSQTPTTSTADRQYSSTDSGGASTATSDSVSLLPENMRDLSGYYNGAKHNHGIPEGTQFITAVNFEGKSFTSIGFAASGAHVHGEHSHSVSIPGHKHSVDIPGHSHNVSIPGHSHNFQIPGHGHSITINASSTRTPLINGARITIKALLGFQM
jgi:hypothetical protein